MSETILGGARYDDIYGHAASYKRQLECKPAFFDKDVAVMNCEGFLKDRLNNPTIADTALRRYERRYPYEVARYQILNNMTELESIPVIDTLIKKNNENYKKLYPKTGRIRETLIKNDRIDLYSVTPKLKGLKKILLKLKTMI